MLKRLADYASPILNFLPIRRTRRNHALEHATVHLLQRKFKELRVSGVSTTFGFLLFHNAPAELVDTAAHDALKRLKKGESGLAVHPNCGTNLMTTGVLATLVAVVLWWGNRKLTRARLNMTLLGMVGAVIVGQPLGMEVQKHFTTAGDPGDLAIRTVHTETVKFPTWGRKFSVTLVWTAAG
ncbi:MAG: hypothetical protein IPK52_17420 [Chloroflexi bacterium]|nr:hypothetical protein [Chloroflexota bacterium]